MKINPYKTIEHKDWDNISWYDDYNGRCTDSILFVVDCPTEEQEKFLEAINIAQPDLYNWNYSHDVGIDYEDNCAYAMGYGEQDYILTDCEVIGKRMFDNKDVSFIDIEEEFINNPNKAISSWLDLPDEWEERSCNFNNGLHKGRQDQPKEILKRLADKFDVVFKINSIDMFNTNFCVFTREKE